MAEVVDDLLDYDEEEQTTESAVPEAVPSDGSAAKKDIKGTYVSIHSSGFRDFLLKPELLRAIVDCGFEHPSAVQHECIPQAILGKDSLYREFHRRCHCTMETDTCIEIRE